MNSSLNILASIIGLDGPELIVILVIILLLFGGSKLPSLARGLGKSVKEFKKASDMDTEDDDDDDEKKSSKKNSTASDSKVEVKKEG
jgi:sec-independent protein translocase protein TatA